MYLSQWNVSRRDRYYVQTGHIRTSHLGPPSSFSSWQRGQSCPHAIWEPWIEDSLWIISGHPTRNTKLDCYMNKIWTTPLLSVWDLRFICYSSWSYLNQCTGNHSTSSSQGCWRIKWDNVYKSLLYCLIHSEHASSNVHSFFTRAVGRPGPKKEMEALN